MQTPKFQNPLAFIKNRLSSPELLQSYVNAGVAITNMAVAPFNKLLKHLLTVQGIDPNTEPGLRARQLFQQAVDEAFGGRRKEYDDDFDLSWVTKKFQQTRNELSELDLCKEDFLKMTDVGNLKATRALDVDQQLPGNTKTTLRPDVQSGMPLTIDQSPIDELADLLRDPLNTPEARAVYRASLATDPVNQVSPEPIEATRENAREWSGELSLKDALERLFKLAKSFQDGDYGSETSHELGREEAEKLIERTGELKGVKKAVESAAAKSWREAYPVRSNPKISRSKTGRTKVVKTTKKGLNKSTTPKNQVSSSEAHELAREMMDRGLCSEENLHEQIDEILKFNQASFESLKRVVMRRPLNQNIKKPVQERHADGRFKGSFSPSPRR